VQASDWRTIAATSHGTRAMKPNGADSANISVIIVHRWQEGKTPGLWRTSSFYRASGMTRSTAQILRHTNDRTSAHQHWRPILYTCNERSL